MRLNMDAIKKTNKMIDHKKTKEFDDLLRDLKQHAKMHGFRLNPDKEIVETIVSALIKRKAECGETYCPCRMINDNKKDNLDIICPCKDHQKDIAQRGHCHCQLFVK